MPMRLYSRWLYVYVWQYRNAVYFIIRTETGEVNEMVYFNERKRKFLNGSMENELRHKNQMSEEKENSFQIFLPVPYEFRFIGLWKCL